MIDIKNISLSLRGTTILEDVSLFIESGSTHIILGPSGAGKSTILKAILGLVEIDNGSVMIDGEEISSSPENRILQIRRKIGVVFQGNALFDSLTVAENTGYFLANFTDLPQEGIDDKIREVLSFVNLDGCESLYPDQLSGGMKKRLAVARALATEPKIILFDEPTTGLDPINSKAILNLIKKLKTRGTTSVVVTHILNDAIMIGDVLTMINNGRIVASGSINEILQSENKFVKDFFYEVYRDLNFTKQNYAGNYE